MALRERRKTSDPDVKLGAQVTRSYSRVSTDSTSRLSESTDASESVRVTPRRQESIIAVAVLGCDSDRRAMTAARRARREKKEAPVFFPSQEMVETQVWEPERTRSTEDEFSDTEDNNSGKKGVSLSELRKATNNDPVRTSSTRPVCGGLFLECMYGGCLPEGVMVTGYRYGVA